MRLLVCGGRDYTDTATLYRVLDAVHKRRSLVCVIHGDARGADRLAGTWAETRGVLIVSFLADWKTNGRAPVRFRKQQMIDHGKPTGVVAFPGGAGTADMIRRAKAVGLKVWEPCAKSSP